MTGVTPYYWEGSSLRQRALVSQSETVHLQHTWESGSGLATGIVEKGAWALVP